jgi:alkanesulfonate monooxygenase
MEESAMTIQFIADASIPAMRASADGQALRDFAAAAEQSRFDGIGLPDSIQGQDAIVLASYILHSTTELGVAAAHDAGLVAPDVAAQQIATLDRLSGGRLTIAVAENCGQNHEERQGRLDEYLVLLKRLWTNDRAFDHEGKYYRLTGALTAMKPYCGGLVPIALGGRSGLAIKVAARHADIFALPASTFAATGLTVERVRHASATHRRANAIRFSYPLRVVIGGSKAEAWATAERGIPGGGVPGRSWNDAARLRGLAVEPGRAAADATLIAGTPEQIALAILDYHAIGISDFVLHGLASTEDLAAFGSQVIPLVRNAARNQGAHADDLTAILPLALRELPWRPV